MGALATGEFAAAHAKYARRKKMLKAEG
jgi:hypothetical protein